MDGFEQARMGRAAAGRVTLRAWLALLAVMVYAMVLVGGATRLTDSGLSITEWDPISGALPPLGDAAWHAEFEKYRQTAEYQMHPRANPQRREKREGRSGKLKGRTQEIQRLIGRSLRAALDLDALGSRMITVDCDVLEADGGTRTASVTAGFVAVAMALYKQGLARVMHDQVAAISVGLVKGEVCVDLDYIEDSGAHVDMNIVATRGGRLIEVQGTSEAEPIERAQFDALLNAGLDSMKELCAMQQQALEAADMSLAPLLKA